MTRPIVREGAMSEVELLRMQRQSAELQLQMDEKQNKYLTEAGAELVKTEAELAQAKKRIWLAEPTRLSVHVSGLP